MAHYILLQQKPRFISYSAHEGTIEGGESCTMRILTTTEYLETPRPQLNWLIHNKLPYPGILLLEGPPKTGKSFLAFDMARSISQGIPFLGWVTRKSKSLYLQFDTSELIWRQRLEHMRDHQVDLSGPLYTVHPEDMLLPINILNYQHQEWLRSLIKFADPEVTVLDVFREIHNADENDSTQMKNVGDILVDIFKGRSLVLVHHSKKIGDDIIEPDPSNVARGSSYLTGKVDALWLLWQSQLYIQSRTEEPQKIRLIQSPSGIWVRKT